MLVWAASFLKIVTSMRWLGCLKSRAALFTLVICVLATLSGVAMYVLSTSSDNLGLPRCWVFEGNSGNEILDCSKVGPRGAIV